MRTEGCPSSPTVARANAVGSGRRSGPTLVATASSSTKRSNGSRSATKVVESLLIAPEDAAEKGAAEPTEHAAFLLATAARARRGGDDPVGEPREGHRLQDHLSRARERGEEEPLSAEQRRLHPRDELDVVLDALLHRHDAARIHTEHIARLEVLLPERAGCMKHRHAVAADALQDESLAAEEARADSLGERDVHLRPLRRAEEGIILRNDDAA